MRVYPRVCGGTRPGRPAPSHLGGLSPRVRGNHSMPGLSHSEPRSIPACAGEPYSRRRLLSRNWVYPRVCGGTIFFILNPHTVSGLSPRVRGNPRYLALGDDRTWSIPACAGEPRHDAHRVPYAAVYPRVCGGTTVVTRSPHSAHGLSPRVRGNLTLSSSRASLPRSIPACAGEPIRR